MRKQSVAWSVVAAMALASSGFASTILPEDDVTYRGTAIKTTMSLFTKGNGTSDRAYVEFPLGSESATSAVLKLYNYWGHPRVRR